MPAIGQEKTDPAVGPPRGHTGGRARRLGAEDPSERKAQRHWQLRWLRMPRRSTVEPVLDIQSWDLFEVAQIRRQE